MLKLLQLDKVYSKGERDWLYYTNDKNETVRVLDVTGSYGINLLGFSNVVERDYHRTAENLPPAFMQGSINIEQQQLSASLIRLMENHTGKNGWDCAYANTGTEIIEASIKILSLHYQARVNTVLQNINDTINILVQRNTHADIVDELEKQSDLIQRRVKFIHFENSFHGKTLGALALVGNGDLKSSFPYPHIGVLCKKEPSSLDDAIKQHTISYWHWDNRFKKVGRKQFVAIAGIFLEPIQGEAGVLPLSESLLHAIGVNQKKYDIPVASDEIQCGLFRTGTFSALDHNVLTADIYCFGKALGAGVTKISVLLCRNEIYPKDFFRLHSSSFGEDHHSSWVANRFLSEIEKQHERVNEVRSNRLLKKLQAFHDEFPELIIDVRGNGHMLSLELNMDVIHQSYITKFFKDLDLIGYWIASVLLNREHIRVYPTLSNPSTLRIQPSIWFAEEETTVFLEGLRRLFGAILGKNVQYLFSHIFPLPLHKPLVNLPDGLHSSEIPEGAAIFICHPIDTKHIRDILEVIDHYSDETLNETLDELSEQQKFTVYHVDKLQNVNGEEIDVVYFGIPLTSLSFYHALRSGRRESWIKKIQDVVDLANAKKARSIGLGQYTSIITNNGLRLKSPSVSMTTGNAYTAGLIIQAIDRTMAVLSKTYDQSTCCIVGAGGNIMSVISEILAERFRNVNLVYHADYRTHKETEEKVCLFLQKLKRSPDAITVSSDLALVHQADVIIVGTNDPRAILTSSHIKTDAIVVDISVPANCAIDVQQSNKITYIRGGIAALPVVDGSEQHLKSVILPFSAGECYACMAETFGIAWQRGPIKHHIGDLSREIVESVLSMMDSQGFGLKRIRVEDTI
jgi:acetylornithine/succinyldiaminopimelate/putrescine aminotransferase/predicted amino acid dehydrogenase